MKIEKNWHLILLDELLAAQGGYISSRVLAERAMTSVRTVKSDLAYLRPQLVRECIAKIESQKAQGYRMLPLDPSAFSQFVETLSVYKALFQDRSIEAMNCRLSILQQLLANDAIKIDDIADTLFMSRSAIAQDMTWAVKFLRSYQLKVTSIPGKGVRIKGLEQNIRSAMVEIYCSQYYDIDYLYPVKAFLAWFDLSSYEDIRHAMLKVVRESSLSLTDISTKKLATHICLAKNRNAAGHTIHLEESLCCQIRRWPEYTLAKQIFTCPEISRFMTANEMDVLNFAKLLLINRDVYLQNEEELESLPLSAVEENNALLEIVRREMREGIGSAYFSSDLFARHQRDLASVQIRIVLRHQFDLLGKRRFITYSEQGSTTCSPLSMELTRQHIGILQREYQTLIRGAEVMALAALYDLLLREIRIPYQKMVLAVFTMEGRTVADRLRKYLLREFGMFIGRIDVFNLYEMRRVDFAAYDAAISTWDPPYYRYPLRFVSCRGIHPSQDREKLFRELFIHGFSKQVLHRLQSMTFCFTDQKMEDYRSIIRDVSQRYGHTPEQRARISQTFQDRFSVLSYYNPDMGISMIFLDHADCGRELIDIYRPAQTLYWQFSMEIRYVVVVCLDKSREISELRLLDQMLQRVQQDRACLERVIQDPITGWESIWRAVLEDLYL